MSSNQGTRNVAIAYLSRDVNPRNTGNRLGYKSQSLRRILMFCCGPRRGGVNHCRAGARTIAPDVHACAGIHSNIISELVNMSVL